MNTLPFTLIIYSIFLIIGVILFIFNWIYVSEVKRVKRKFGMVFPLFMQHIATINLIGSALFLLIVGLFWMVGI